MAAEGSRIAVLAALIGNTIIAVSKFVVAALSGSVAMLSEGFHSVADAGNQALLLWGMLVSRRPATALHPFGRGKEVYFWSFMVAVMLFVGGAVLSFQHGLDAVRHPHELTNLAPNFVVLAAAICIEGVTFYVAAREFNRYRGSRNVWRAMRASKDSAILVVLLEDAAAMAGLLIALAGVGLSAATGNAVWDGVASLGIALILATVAVLLAVETKALLIGEAASRSDRAAMRSAVLALPEVAGVGELLTMHMGPEEILVNLEVDFVAGLSQAEVEQSIEKVEAALRARFPGARNVFVEMETSSRG